MSRVVRSAAAALFALVLAVPAPAAPRPADASPLKIVPASAPIVVHLRGAEGTKDRFLAMLKNALPEVHPVVEAYIDKALKGEFTEGRTFRGLAKDGPHFVVFTELPKGGDEKNFAFILSVTKYAEFRDNVLKEEERKNLKTEDEGYEWTKIDGDPIYFVNKKDFAIVCPTKEVAVSFTKKHKGMDEHISKEQAARLLGDDAGIYVSMDSVNKEYADQIKMAKETIRSTLKTIADAAEANQRGTFELMLKLLDPAFQAVEDSRGIVFSIAFRPNGLALHLETELRDGTPTAKSLEGSKLSAFKSLDAMPSGQMVYTGMESSKAMMSALGGLAFGMMVDPESKEGKAAMDALAELVKAAPGTRLDAVNLPLQSIQVAHYGEPAKAMEAQIQLIQSLAAGANYSAGQLKEKPKVTPKAQKYGDFEFTSVELKWDLDKMVEAIKVPLSDDAKKQLGEAFKKMLGEGQTTWIGTDGKVVLQVSAKDWATAKKYLKEHAKGTDKVGAQPAYRDVRKQLPEESSMLAVVDLVRYVEVVLSITRPVMESMMPLKIPSAPADLAPTYCGGAVTMKADRAAVDVFISAATVHQIYKFYIQPLTAGLGGAAN